MDIPMPRMNTLQPNLVTNRNDKHAYHFLITTTAGIRCSCVDAWKFHVGYPTKPEEFARHYAEKLFRYRGIVSVEVTILCDKYPVDRYFLDTMQQCFLWGETETKDIKILKKLTFTRDDFNK